MSLVLALFLSGLFLGSFLGVLVERLPKDEPITGRSYCPNCKKRLKWYHLVPVLSYIYLQGKCGYCRKPIPSFYPVIEITTGVIFVLVFYFLNTPLTSGAETPFVFYPTAQSLVSLLFYLFISSCLIVIFFADLRWGIIPDKVIYPAILLGVLYFLTTAGNASVPGFLEGVSFFNRTLSALGSSVFFLSLFAITKGRGMGLGDVKLSFFLGFFLGFPSTIYALYVAFLTGALYSLILILWGKKSLRKSTISFGPFLVLGTFLALFLSPALEEIIHTVFSIP